MQRTWVRLGTVLLVASFALILVARWMNRGDIRPGDYDFPRGTWLVLLAFALSCFAFGALARGFGRSAWVGVVGFFGGWIAGWIFTGVLASAILRFPGFRPAMPVVSTVGALGPFIGGGLVVYFAFLGARKRQAPQSA